MQPKYMNKEELHRMIDELPDEEVMVLTYRKDSGISDNGKREKKSKAKQFVDKAKVIVLIDTKPIRRVNLEGNFSKFPFVNRENIIKSILLPQIE